jgi:hypothetical protein
MPLNRPKLLQICAITMLATMSYGAPAQQDSQAFEGFKTVSRFAFGGVGIAGRTSEGELYFRILMQQDKPKALAQLEKLYAEGNPQAKAYALAGLHVLNPQRFNDLNATLPQTTVTTMRGCIVGSESLASITKEIASGEFDQFVTTPTPPATPPHPQSPPAHPPQTPPHPAT